MHEDPDARLRLLLLLLARQQFPRDPQACADQQPLESQRRRDRAASA
jgi:hypothetical protein